MAGTGAILSRRGFGRAVASLAAVGLPGAAALAQGYPDRTIRLVVPFAPGGNADVNGRIAAEVMQAALGQPVIVENRAGAGGGLGAEAVARAAPDGYTLLLGSNGPLTVNPAVNANLRYDPQKDFAPVAMLSYTPHTLFLARKLDIGTIAELVALSKRRPVTLASSGVGSATHMTIERFKAATGATITHVPYGSGGALQADVISGNIDGAMTELATSLELHKGGQARIVAVAAMRRPRLAPDIPTFDEQGVKGFVAQSFVGVMAPARTPAEAIDKVQRAITAGLAAGTSAAGRLTATGSDLATPEQMTPAGFAAVINQDYEDMRAAARLAGLGAK